jgi:hypothetical protein
LRYQPRRLRRIDGCSAGEPEGSDLGTPGCCAETPVSLTVRYTCSNGLLPVLSDGSSLVFVHACPYHPNDVDPIDYTLDYRF